MSNVPATTNHSWHQLPDETDTAYHRFSIYLELGPDRSIPKVREKLGKRQGYERHLYRWSSGYDWVHRAGEYDSHMIRKTLKNKEEIIDRAQGRLLRMVDSALDALEEAVNLPAGEITGIGYTKNVREKLRAVDMVLNRVGIVEQTSKIDPEKPTEVNNYIQNIYQKIENYNQNGKDHG